MTQTQVKQKLTDLFSNFLIEIDLEKLKIIKEQIIKLYSAIPFSESNSVLKEMELKLLDDTSNLYINCNLNSYVKSTLLGDFDRLLISLSLSLLEV